VLVRVLRCLVQGSRATTPATGTAMASVLRSGVKMRRGAWFSSMSVPNGTFDPERAQCNADPTQEPGICFAHSCVRFVTHNSRGTEVERTLAAGKASTELASKASRSKPDT
jgi:hypothetical protein